MSTSLQNLEALLGHVFKNKALLEQALTHASVTRHQSYERLEFLGDRVLGAVVADLLYCHYPKELEGALARRFTRLVCTETLADIALSVELNNHMIIAKGERSTGGHHKPSLLADVCEAVIAALYLDGGMDVASAFIKTHWIPLLEKMILPPVDAKTALQELSQSKKKGIPIYTHLLQQGPNHAPLFTVEVTLEGYPPQQATGTSKRIAEQEAARKLLDLMEDRS